jgi:hypothetical protein
MLWTRCGNTIHRSDRSASDAKEREAGQVESVGVGAVQAVALTRASAEARGGEKQRNTSWRRTDDAKAASSRF